MLYKLPSEISEDHARHKSSLKQTRATKQLYQLPMILRQYWFPYGHTLIQSWAAYTHGQRIGKGAMCISWPHFMTKTSYKNSKGHIEVLTGHPLSFCSPSPSLLSSLSQSAPSLSLLFLSIASTKHPIQAPMTSLRAGSGKLYEQWPHGNKGQFIRLWSDR